MASPSCCCLSKIRLLRAYLKASCGWKLDTAASNKNLKLSINEVSVWSQKSVRGGKVKLHPLPWHQSSQSKASVPQHWPENQQFHQTTLCLCLSLLGSWDQLLVNVHIVQLEQFFCFFCSKRSRVITSDEQEVSCEQQWSLTLLILFILPPYSHNPCQWCSLIGLSLFPKIKFV